jgi:hypothetical protein
MSDGSKFKASILKKEAVVLFETLATVYMTKGCNKPEDHRLNYYNLETPQI